MADQKITDLTALVSVDGSDLLAIVDDPAGTPITKKVTVSNLLAGNVVESTITLADNTTNNASTTKHGFLKKLSNVATEYMDGTGNYSVPAGSGGGGLVLLEQHTASASASLNFTTAITSAYDDYVFKLVGLVPATNNQDIEVRFSTDGGSTWITGTAFYYS